MKTAIVPIIKCKTGNSSDKDNYRPIGLVTACFKIFELCLLEIIEVYLDTYTSMMIISLALKNNTQQTCAYLR